MRTRELQFDGIAYVCRMIKSNDGDELIIGPTDLLDALQPAASMTRTKALSMMKPGSFTMKCSTSRTLPVSDCLTMN